MKGILFKPDLIKAIAEGRKTQTRRVIKFRERVNPISSYGHGGIGSIGDIQRELEALDKGIIKPDISLSPYQPGETVYIKETFQVCDIVYDEYAGGSEAGYPLTVVPTVKPAYQVMATYKLDGIDDGPWRSPIFMPAWAARYLIVITEVKAQRVQEITQENAIAEGIVPPEHAFVMIGGDVDAAISPREEYAELWDAINPKHPWESNPWVWVYTFRLKEANDANP